MVHQGEAAWAPDHKTMLLFPSGSQQPVLVRADGPNTRETPLRLPPPNTELDLMWNWSFSPDSDVAAVVVGRSRSGEWTWRMEIRPLPWGEPRFEKEYKTKERVFPRLASSPTASRFVYWRGKVSGNIHELIGVDVSSRGVTERRLAETSQATDKLGFPPVWSPDGNRVAWVAGTTAWMLEWSAEDPVKLGELPESNGSWSWTAPVAVSFAAALKI